jgi:hypothetical protein
MNPVAHEKYISWLSLLLLCWFDEITDIKNLRKDVLVLLMVSVHFGNKNIVEQCRSHHEAEICLY